MIRIEVERKGDRFKFAIFNDDQWYVDCKFTPLSDECVRLTKAEGDLTPAINEALARKAYEMGYKRLVFNAPPDVEVTRLARLQRKAAKAWFYLIPLEELYGG